MAVLSLPAGIRFPMQADMWVDHLEIRNEAMIGFFGEVTTRRAQVRAFLRWPIMEQADEDVIGGILAACRGTINALKIPNYKYRNFVGAGAAGLTFSGAHSAGAETITASGGGLEIGDWIQLRLGTPRMHRITSVAGSTYGITPPLRKDEAGGATIRTLNNGYPLECSMNVAGGVGSAPVFPSPIGSKGQLVQGRTVEFVETSTRGDLA